MKEFWYVLWRLPLTIAFSLPAMIASLVYHHFIAGWALGEYLFDTDAFISNRGKPSWKKQEPTND